MEKAWDLFWQTGKVTDYLKCCVKSEACEEKIERMTQENGDDSPTEGKRNEYVTAGGADRYGAYFHADRGI